MILILKYGVFITTALLLIHILLHIIFNKIRDYKAGKYIENLIDENGNEEFNEETYAKIKEYFRKHYPINPDNPNNITYFK